MAIWEASLQYELYYLGIIITFSTFAFCLLTFIARKIGFLKVLSGLRLIITFHWVFKLIILIRSKFHTSDHIIEAINNVVNNDEDIVKEIIENENY